MVGVFHAFRECGKLPDLFWGEDPIVESGLCEITVPRFDDAVVFRNAAYGDEITRGVKLGSPLPDLTSVDEELQELAVPGEGDVLPDVRGEDVGLDITGSARVRGSLSNCNKTILVTLPKENQ